MPNFEELFTITRRKVLIVLAGLVIGLLLLFVIPNIPGVTATGAHFINAIILVGVIAAMNGVEAFALYFIFVFSFAVMTTIYAIVGFLLWTFIPVMLMGAAPLEAGGYILFGFVISLLTRGRTVVQTASTHNRWRTGSLWE